MVRLPKIRGLPALRREPPGVLRMRLLPAAVAVLLALAASCACSPKVEGGRPAAWAAPIEKPGLPNLHRVDDGLYRCAQPTAAGMREAEKMGVRTVVNLRSLHSDRDEIAGTKLAYEHIPMHAWHAEEEDVVRFLKIVEDPANRPVLVHCQHGADRTGMVVAAYRVIVDGWSKDEAIREMTGGGFGYHTMWENLVDYIREMDPERVRREVAAR